MVQDGEQVRDGNLSLRGFQGELPAYMADGAYENLLTGEPVNVTGGRLVHDGNPIILKLDTDSFLEKEMRMD